MPNIAINGFGRIGKLLVRRLADEGLLDSVILLNVDMGDAQQHAHLLEFDTVHGRWLAEISADDDHLYVNNASIAVTAHRSIEAMPLKALNIDLLIDCTGAYRTTATLQPYFDQGVKRVLVSCPVKEDEAINIVYGVNHQSYDSSTHRIVTAASCTTNCIAPVIKVLQDNIGISHGSITTIHNVTNTQTIVDRPAKDLRRARSALNSLIPTTTGSATAIGLIYPELQGRLNGHAIRVPLLNASITDCVFEMVSPVTVAVVNELMHQASQNELKGILGFETRPLVSADYTNDSRSAVIDAASTMVVNGTQLKLYVWYDNEWGYSCRMADIVRMLLE